jgi:hypothetical protein
VDPGAADGVALLDRYAERVASQRGGRLWPIDQPSTRQLKAASTTASFAQRELLTIGRQDVTVRTSENGSISAWETHGRPNYLRASTDSSVPSGTASGVLQAFLNPWRWGGYLAITVSVGDRVASMWLSRELDETAHDPFEGYRNNIDEFEDERTMLHYQSLGI